MKQQIVEISIYTLGLKVLETQAKAFREYMRVQAIHVGTEKERHNMAHAENVEFHNVERQNVEFNNVESVKMSNFIMLNQSKCRMS